MIACIVCDVDVSTLEAVLTSIALEKSFNDGLQKSWAVGLMILGEWCPPSLHPIARDRLPSLSDDVPASHSASDSEKTFGSGAFESSGALGELGSATLKFANDVHSYRDMANLWYRCVPSESDHSRPVISDVYCCGHRFITNNNEIVFFDYPERGTFYASVPPVLDPSAYDSGLSSVSDAASTISSTVSGSSSLSSPARGASDVGLSRGSSNPAIGTSHTPMRPDPILDDRREMQMVMAQLNSAHAVAQWLDAGLRPNQCSDSSAGTEASASVSLSRSNVTWYSRVSSTVAYACFQVLMGLMLLSLPLALFLYRIYSDVAKPILSTQLPAWMFGASLRIKSLSLAALQAEFRYGELCSWPRLYRQLEARHRQPFFVCDPSYRAHQLHLYDSVVRATFDSFCGVVGAVLLFVYADSVLSMLNNLYLFIEIDVLRSYVTWFMGEPSGFKLNPELTIWLGSAALSALSAWEFLIQTLRSIEFAVLALICVTGFSGASVMIAICSDVFSILTFQVYVLYVCSAFLYKAQLSVMRSFWALFAGKKYNVLRKRVDSHEYDLLQLLLGTLLFCSTFFLFPTVVMYYCFFATVRLVILSMQFLLNINMYALSHFPFFSVFVRLFRPELLPGGIYLQVYPSALPVNDNRPTLRHSASIATLPNLRLPVRARRLVANYFLLLSTPVSWDRLFYRIRNLLSLCASHYPISLVWRQVSRGIIVPPPPREQIYTLGLPSAGDSLDIRDLREFVKSFILETGPRRLLIRRIASSFSFPFSKVKTD